VEKILQIWRCGKLRLAVPTPFSYDDFKKRAEAYGRPPRHREGNHQNCAELGLLPSSHLSLPLSKMRYHAACKFLPPIIRRRAPAASDWNTMPAMHKCHWTKPVLLCEMAQTQA